MRFYTGQHDHYCGTDLHARSMYLCVLDRAGEVRLHRDFPASPESFLRAVAPFREGLVVGAECMFTWYWLADRCAAENIPFVLGHALYMKAIHGGKSKNDRIDSLETATLLRGGAIAHAYVYPPKMRATRALLRRRTRMVPRRAELIAHVQNTHHPYNLAAPGPRLAYTGNHEGVPEHFRDPTVRRSVELDLELARILGERITDLELYLVRQAKEHDPNAFHLLRSIPGVGKILALTILYEVHTIERFPRVQDFASYCRLVKCSRESAGKIHGTGGAKIGNVHLKWAYSEAATLFLHGNPEGQRLRGALIGVVIVDSGSLFEWRNARVDSFTRGRSNDLPFSSQRQGRVRA
ncbi:MAG: IS110 family transposase [bacterium]